MKNDKMIKELTMLIKEEMAKYPTAKLILFGSQANGTAKEDSDYDFLILVDEKMPKSAFPEVTFSIQKRLWNLGKAIPIDIIVKYSKQFYEEMNSFGSLAYYAQKEGIVL